METQRDVEEFWRKKEEELQEAVLFRSIGQWVRPSATGATEVFGLLYATESRLLFEYSDKPRRSILESLMRSRQEEKMDESLVISRQDIRWARLAASPRVRQWVRRDLRLEQIEEEIVRPYSEVLRLLLGTHLCIGSSHDFYAFQTPSDREWVERLNP